MFANAFAQLRDGLFDEGFELPPSRAAAYL
jgi:hypothetical protein